MKNNRSIQLNPQFIQEHQVSKTSPEAGSLFWKLWQSCTDIANEVIKTPFIQGIKEGTLDPVIYGGFNISDAYYCFHGASDYLGAANRANDPTLKAFLMKKYNSYDSYNKTFPKKWHIKDANGVVPTDACKEYSAFESNTAATEAPIYSLIVMLPCEYLWAWLGKELSPPSKGNLYAPWITGNNYPDGAYAMGNFISYFQNKYPGSLDTDKAMELYRSAMNYELENFKSATE